MNQIDRDIEQYKNASRELRAEQFRCKVVKLPRFSQWLYENELSLRLTQDGHFWNTISLTPGEAKEVIHQLQKYLRAMK